MRADVRCEGRWQVLGQVAGERSSEIESEALASIFSRMIITFLYTDEWTMNMWYIYTVEYYPAVKDI